MGIKLFAFSLVSFPNSVSLFSVPFIQLLMTSSVPLRVKLCHVLRKEFFKAFELLSRRGESTDALS